MKIMNCLVAGVGGQGSIFVSRLIGLSAIKAGLDVRGCETIGMAQKGGSVVSYVRIGSEINSPMFGASSGDIIIALELAEAARAASYLKEDGLMVVCDRTVVTGKYPKDEIVDYLHKLKGKVIILSSEMILKACDSTSLNVAVLGAGVRTGDFGFGISEIEEVLKEYGSERYRKANLAALDYSASLVP
jgi:indolepyruvate ferredoxin oxidoreductase beta subunit